MKISGHSGTDSPNRPDEVVGARGAANKGRGPRHDTTTGGDKVSVSEEARTLSRLRADVGDISGVRTQKVEELRGKIARGEFQVDLKAVARKFLESIFGGRTE